MNKFDLNAYGVVEMDAQQEQEVNGGEIVLALILLGCTLFAIGYQMGADRAAMDK